MHYGAHNQAIDISALGITPPDKQFGEKEGWKYINSDLMRSANVVSSTSLPSCLPCKRTRGQGNPSQDYIEEIVNGFLLQSQILIDNRDILISSDGPLSKFRTLHRRCILRATQTYFTIQRQQLSQTALSSFFEQSLVLEQLARPFLHRDASHEVWDVLRSEIRQMRSLDIPVFEHMISDGAFNTIGSSNPMFPADSYTALVERYVLFDMSKAKFHSDLIRSSFEAASLHQPVPLTRQKQSPPERDSNKSRLLQTIPQERSVGNFVVEHLIHHAHLDSYGRCQWLGYNHHSSGVYSYYPLNTSLYSGVAAIPIFLSSYQSTCSASLELSDSDLALFHGIHRSSISTLNYMSGHADRSAILRWWRDLPPGLNGCGGVLLSLSLLGTASPDGLLLPEVFDLIASKPILSLTNGLMGLIGPLLNLSSPLAIELSLRLGRHFADTIQPSLTTLSSLSPGLASGISGLVVVYSRLYCITNENLFLEQARFWLKHERAMLHELLGQLNSSKHGCGSLRDAPRPSAASCPDLFNGLSGLILSRLLLLGTPIWDDECTSEISLFVLLLLDHSGTLDGINLAYGALGPISVLDLMLRFDLGFTDFLPSRIKHFVDEQWSVSIHSLLSPRPRLYPCRSLTTLPIGFFNGITGLGLYSQALSSSRHAFDLLLTGGLLAPVS
jgi:lantibiotic modifying enzyme